MAETSGFLTDLPQSAYLSASMRRAISAAQQRSHRYVTVEHLLLALLDDLDAIAILEAVRADVPGIRTSITDTVNRNLSTLYTPGEFDLRASYKVERVLQTASDDAARLGCDEVDATFVIATLSREGDNPAGEILKRHGFSYSSAMTWLYGNRGTSPSVRAAKAQSRLTPVPSEPAEAPAAAPAPERQETRPVPPPRTLQSSISELAATLDEEMDDLDLEIVEDDEPVAVSRKPQPRPAAPAPAPKPAAPKPGGPMPDRAAPPTGAQRSQSVPPPAAARSAPRQTVRGDDGVAELRSRKDMRPPPMPAKRSFNEPVEEDSEPDVMHVLRGRSAAEPVRNVEPPRPAAPPPAAAPLPRSMPQLPPVSRLEEMRVGSSANRMPVPAPTPPPPPAKSRGAQRSAPAASPQIKTAPEKPPKGSRQRRQQRPFEALLGRLVENIPRRMRCEVPEHVEVRISREETQILSRGMEGRAEPVRHDIKITQTMSVALRAPDGDFTIEPLSPETQWIFDQPEIAGEGETYGRWHWVITPRETGQNRLQLIIASRSLGANGLVGDSALPDQIINVRVRTNYLRSMARGLQWIGAMLIGGALTEIAMMGFRMFGGGE